LRSFSFICDLCVNPFKMNLFYTPDIASNFHSLSEEESRHCQKVLRMREGETIHLTDGRGTLYEARIVDGQSRQVSVEVIGKQENYGKRDYRVHLAVAPTKNNDRFEWFLEKATEIGVDEITPLICDHSERRHLRLERLEKVITAAVKQSLKAYHPKLNEPLAFSKFIASQSKQIPASPPPGSPASQLPSLHASNPPSSPANLNSQNKFIAYITEGAPSLKQLYQSGSDAVILIGPEGDFSNPEVDAAIKSGFRVVSLGESRLRTETAAVVACHTVALSSGF